MKKVIVQDTDPDLLETLNLVLKEAKFEVLPLLHYQEVFNKIQTFSPNLVLLDFKLSGEESIRICKLIKKSFPGLPVIALSCNMNIQETYAKAGFDNYIEKPFDLNDLLSVVQNCSCQY